jgi:AcrR family transcriptional regulator
MPKIVDPDQQRAAILRATWNTISKFGIAGVTVRRIAEEAEVSTGFISHYFRDKKEVLAASLDLCNEQSRARLKRRAEGLRGLAALRAVIEGVLPLDKERRLEWLIWLSFWGPSAADPALGRAWKEGREEWRDTVTSFLEQARADGDIRADLDVSSEADRIVVLVVGLGMHEGSRRMRGCALNWIDAHLRSLGSKRDRATATPRSPGRRAAPRRAVGAPRRAVRKH